MIIIVVNSESNTAIIYILSITGIVHTRKSGGASLNSLTLKSWTVKSC